MRTAPSGWAFWTFQGLVTDILGAGCHLPTYQRGNQGPEMGRGSPSVTQHLVQAGGAQVWRVGALHSVCLQDGKEDAQLSAGRAGLVGPGRVQGLAPLGQDGFEQPEQADLLGQPWATWRRPLGVDAPSPAGLTASSLIRPRSAASGALVGTGSGASVAPSCSLSAGVGTPEGRPRPGHPGACTQAGARRERGELCVWPCDPEVRGRRRAGPGRGPAGAGELCVRPCDPAPGDTAERPLPWWPLSWPPRFATSRSCGRGQARDRQARAGPCPEWVQGGRGWPLGPGTLRDRPPTAPASRACRGGGGGACRFGGRSNRGLVRACAVGASPWSGPAGVGGGDRPVLLHVC